MEECYDVLGLSTTLKMHIISDHLADYFDLTGKTLLNVSDEHIEAIHSAYRKFNERHSYKIRDVTSDIHHKKQEKSLLHWNSINV